MDVVGLISKYGFPIVFAVGMGLIIKYVWTWATQEVKPVISDANTVLIALIDRIRMLDNDLIRLNQKVNTVLHLRGKIIESDRVMEQMKVEKEANEIFDEASKLDEVKKKNKFFTSTSLPDTTRLICSASGIRVRVFLLPNKTITR